MKLTDKASYTKTYFRIEAGYAWGHGLPEAMDEAFHEEIKALLTCLGFEYKEPRAVMSCFNGKRGLENLYCHPMNLSGFIRKDNVHLIEQAIKDFQPKTFRLRFTDCFGDYRNYTDKEFADALEERRGAVVKAILEAYRTKRSKVGRFYRDLSTGLHYLPNTALSQMETSFVLSVFQRLKERGLIIEMKDEAGAPIFRTALAKEIRSMRTVDQIKKEAVA